MRCCARQIVMVLLLAAGSACGQGTIRYVDISPDLFMFSPLINSQRTVPVDIDGDGTADFVFRATPSLFDIYGIGNNRVLAFPNHPPDLSRYAVPLSVGDVISPSLQPQYVWAESQYFGSPRDPLGVVFNGGFETIIGTFVNRKGYVGLEFQIGGNIHYGWIQLDCETFYNNGGYVLDYAYELRPGAGIFAGAVPEPSTCALVGFGFLALLIQRRRKSAG